MKKIILLIFALVFIWPFQVYGHTTLTDSHPAEGESIPGSLDEVKLKFGTSIEEASTISLEGENSSISFEEIIVSDNLLSGRLSEDLPSGTYVIHWKIIGADGHPIKGEIPFAVPPQDNETAEKTEPAESLIEEVEEPLKEATADSSEEKSGGGSMQVTVLLIIAGLLMVYGLYKILSRKP